MWPTGLNTELKTKLAQKIKLIDKTSNFIYKSINFFCHIRYETILTYEHLTKYLTKITMPNKDNHT